MPLRLDVDLHHLEVTLRGATGTKAGFTELELTRFRGHLFRPSRQEKWKPRSRRGVAPQFVEDAIASSRGVLQPNGNISHTSGSLQVILNLDGAVVTIITH